MPERPTGRLGTVTRRPPTVRQRRLAAELLQLRDAAGMSRDDVAERTDLNTATLYRLEMAQVRPQKRTITALLDLYEVVEPRRSYLVTLARSSSEQGWLQAYENEISEEYSTYIQLEDEALAVRNYETILIPGLLQTEMYIRAVIVGMAPSASPERVEQQVKIRTSRQQVLTREHPLHLWAIIDEAAVHRQVGGVEVMREQLTHLVAVAAQPNVTLQVVPYTAGAHPGMPGGFSLLTFKPPVPEVAYTSGPGGNLFQETAEDLARYSALYDHLRASALSTTDTTQLLTQLAQGTGQ